MLSRQPRMRVTVALADMMARIVLGVDGPRGACGTPATA